MAKKALNLEDIFLVSLVLLNDVGVCIYCKKVFIATFLAILAPRTFFVLVFLTRLALVDGRLLVLTIKYVSGGSVNKLNPSGVLFLLFCKSVFLGIP